MNICDQQFVVCQVCYSSVQYENTLLHLNSCVRDNCYDENIIESKINFQRYFLFGYILNLFEVYDHRINVNTSFNINFVLNIYLHFYHNSNNTLWESPLCEVDDFLRVLLSTLKEPTHRYINIIPGIDFYKLTGVPNIGEKLLKIFSQKQLKDPKLYSKMLL